MDKTRDKKYLLIAAENSDTTEFRYLKADTPHSDFTVFQAREPKQRYYLDHRGDLFYIRSNKNATNFQVFTAPEKNPDPKNWKIFIPYDDQVFVRE